MSLAPALRLAICVLRGRSDDLLPAFLLTPAVPATVRVVGLAGVVVAALIEGFVSPYYYRPSLAVV